MKKSDWINVKDKLPTLGNRVLVCQTFNDDDSMFARTATLVKTNGNYMWYDDDGFEVEYITHWQRIVLPKN